MTLIDALSGVFKIHRVLFGRLPHRLKPLQLHMMNHVLLSHLESCVAFLVLNRLYFSWRVLTLRFPPAQVWVPALSDRQDMEGIVQKAFLLGGMCSDKTLTTDESHGWRYGMEQMAGSMLDFAWWFNNSVRHGSRLLSFALQCREVLGFFLDPVSLNMLLLLYLSHIVALSAISTRSS